MEDRVSRLERKLVTLKSNVEGLHAVRVDVDNRIGSLNSDVSTLSNNVTQLH